MKKFLSIIFGIVWIIIIPIYIIAMIFVSLFTDVSIQDCLKFWALCIFTLFSGRGFEAYDPSQGDMMPIKIILRCTRKAERKLRPYYQTLKQN